MPSNLDTQVIWSILCFDRRKDHPFPLEPKHYVLDENHITAEDKLAILDLIKPEASPSVPMHGLLNEPVVTRSFSRRSRGREVLRYRPFFRESTLVDDLDNCKSFCTVTVDGEYFEDETGKAITMLEMLDYVHGSPGIVMGRPESVVRFGPSKVKDPTKWDVECSNTLAHFLQVISHIANSSWIRSPLSLTTIGSKIDGASFPSAEAAMGMLAFFRQICSSDGSDDLFNRACGYYLCHVDDSVKADWVKFEKKQFNNMLRQTPIPLFPEVNYSMIELLELFLYDARLMHSRPAKSTKAQSLNSVMSMVPRPRLVMAFHSGMRMLLNHPFTVFPVIRQDFLHWTGELALVGPNIVDIASLFSDR